MMGTFITAYAIVWSAVLLYVARMSLQQLRLSRRLAAFERTPFENREQSAEAA
jgi:CcmD family protein